MFKRLFALNWKTTVAAVVFLAASVVEKKTGLEIPPEVLQSVEAVALFAIGLFAADSNPQTPKD